MKLDKFIRAKFHGALLRRHGRHVRSTPHDVPPEALLIGLIWLGATLNAIVLALQIA